MRAPSSRAHTLLGVATALIGVTLLLPVVVTPLPDATQAIFGALLVVACLALRGARRHDLVFVAVIVGLVASARYVYWRITLTSSFDATRPLDLVFGGLLLLSELYAFVILVLGRIVTARPLARRPVQLPADSRTWPSVDVFIPTYDEPLDVVRTTVLGARALDWPEDRLHVWLLDDGRRDELRSFAAAAGVGYFRRPDNAHAKAGNLNHALARTSGELIAVFDCDHVPTRAFLQLTVGTLVADPRTAVVQTPHVFYSPDPFERNLGRFGDLPDEGSLFYGLIQPGNDLFDAAFFCGSSAVLRRTALDAIGGFATESVTEDVHTALRLHQKGWKSAYLAVPLAAGLATESLSAHVGQRIRWARGMAQVFRLENPLLCRGLGLMQRVAYLNAMLFFFFGLPRIVFMLAPLMFLLFGAHVFNATPEAILAYGLPHLACSFLVSSRVFGEHRRSFWNEVYETVLAVYVFIPTTLALLAPRTGAFKVTAKGGLVDRTHFDVGIARPMIALAALELIGVAVGLARLGADGDHRGVVLLNLGWASFHLVMLGAALSASLERRQVRRAPRIRAELPAMLILRSGRTVACKTRDLSRVGGSFVLAVKERFAPDETSEAAPEGAGLHISLFALERTWTFPAVFVALDGGVLRARFAELTLDDEAALVRVIFSRADAWLGWKTARTPDRPLRELLSFARRGAALVRHGAASLRLATAGRASS